MYAKFFEAAKYEYVKDKIFGKFIFFLQSKFVFGGILKFLKLVRCLDKKNLTLENSDKKVLRVLYFKGCAGNIFSHTKQILQHIPDIELIEKDFDCCGIPFLSSGNLDRYEEVKEYNLKLINEADFDYILTDCASCESTLKGYSDLNENKFISLGELLVKLNVKFKFEEPLKITFHKPCHLKNADFVKSLFENCENVDYIEMENFDECCGFAGEFALKNRKISLDISRNKAQNIAATGADLAVTVCPSCILGLKQGLKAANKSVKVLTLSEFLIKAKW